MHLLYLVPLIFWSYNYKKIARYEHFCLWNGGYLGMFQIEDILKTHFFSFLGLSMAWDWFRFLDFDSRLMPLMGISTCIIIYRNSHSRRCFFRVITLWHLHGVTRRKVCKIWQMMQFEVSLIFIIIISLLPYAFRGYRFTRREISLQLFYRMTCRLFDFRD